MENVFVKIKGLSVRLRPQEGGSAGWQRTQRGRLLKRFGARRQSSEASASTDSAPRSFLLPLCGSLQQPTEAQPVQGLSGGGSRAATGQEQQA